MASLFYSSNINIVRRLLLELRLLYNNPLFTRYHFVNVTCVQACILRIEKELNLRERRRNGIMVMQ